MLTAFPKQMRGVTLLELMIGITIIGVLMMLGLPAYGEWMANSRIRIATESVLNGLQLARAQALGRNTQVRFQIVTSLTGGCALGGTAPNWIISLDDPAGKCDVAPSDGTAPRTIQSRGAGDASTNVVTVTPTAAGNFLVTFDGFGRVSNTLTAPTRIDFTVPTTLSTSPRRLAIRIAVPGGQISICDPQVTDTTDPRFCS